MAKKYIIVDTNEEVKIGDVMVGSAKIKTSFGVIEKSYEFTVTESKLKELVKEGVVKCIESKPNRKVTNTIGYYIKSLAIKYKCEFEDVIEWLEKTNKVCPKAVLDILLQEISQHFYFEDPQAFDDAKQYYGIRLTDGKVGKVNVASTYIPLFKSVEDAEYAREILKDQLDMMYGKKQKNS